MRKLAADWGRTEAEVIRRALDRLPDPDTSVEARLAAAGLLVPAPGDDDLPSDEEIESLEREYEAWVDAPPEPLGLSEAVLEDRR